MKKSVYRNSQLLVVILFATILKCTPVFSQTDTLRLYYKGLDTKVPDTTEAKIVNWAKARKGQHFDVAIVAYYDKGEFKQFAQTRSDEMFLVMNRKARELITIQSYEPKKGVKSQRSRVDIIYTKALTAEEKAAAEKAEKEKKEKAEKEKKEKLEQERLAKVNSANGASSTGNKTTVDEDKYGRPGIHYAGEGQFLKSTEVAQIKGAKIIVSQTGDKETDDALEKAVKSHWDFTSDVKSMTYKEAKAMAKTDPSVLIFIVASVKSKSLPHNVGPAHNGFQQTYKSVSSGAAVMLEDGKGHALASSYIPSFGTEGLVTEEVLAFGVSAMNYQLKAMSEKNMANNLKIKSAYKEQTEKLKSKTLYIPEDWVSDKLDKSKIGTLYKANYEVVSYEKWRNAILNKEDAAYVIVVPQPIGGSFIYVHYLVDAQTGTVYAMCQPKGAAVNVSGVNVSKANTGLINEKNIERYNESLAGDW
jgi:hypothetical protein